MKAPEPYCILRYSSCTGIPLNPCVQPTANAELGAGGVCIATMCPKTSVALQTSPKSESDDRKLLIYSMLDRNIRSKPFSGRVCFIQSLRLIASD